MKIGFNVSPLQNDNKNRGTGSYTFLLLEALKKLASNDFQILEFIKDVPQEADIVHYPFFDPFFLTLPLLKSKPTVATVHDLIPLKFPDKFPRGVRGEIKWQIQKMALTSAATIITDSSNSALDINKITGVEKNKIHTVSLAPSEIYQPIHDKTKLQNIKKKYNLPDKFLLYVGDVNWNKNIVGLLKAFAEIVSKPNNYSSNEVRSHRNSSRLLASNNKMPKLVLIGKSFLNDNLPEVQDINKLIKELNIEQFIIKLGFVPEEDLVGIYNLASCYVQPSFYEGFGLPVLEAMSCGCPVASSNSSSLPEVGGNAVVYFDPNNVEEMTNTINTILHYDTAQYHSMVKKNIEQAKNFNWQKTAEETIKVYQKVLYE